MKKILRTIDLINEWVGKGISPVVYASAFVLLYEIVSRNVFNKPTPWAQEYSVFFFGIILLAGGYTYLHGRHVSIDILYLRWSIRTRAIVDVATSSIFFYFMVLMLWKGADIARKSLLVMETDRFAWGPPIYIVKTMIPLAALLIILQGLAKLIRDIHIAITGKVIDEH